jgi:hypothetical protein
MSDAIKKTMRLCLQTAGTISSYGSVNSNKRIFPGFSANSQDSWKTDEPLVRDEWRTLKVACGKWED